MKTFCQALTQPCSSPVWAPNKIFSAELFDLFRFEEWAPFLLSPRHMLLLITKAVWLSCVELVREISEFVACLDRWELHDDTKSFLLIFQYDTLLLVQSSHFRLGHLLLNQLECQWNSFLNIFFDFVNAFWCLLRYGHILQLGLKLRVLGCDPNDLINFLKVGLCWLRKQS